MYEKLECIISIYKIEHENSSGIKGYRYKLKLKLNR